MSEQVGQRRTLGRPGGVAAMQRLVDEPLDAVVVVGHRGSFWRFVATLTAAIVAADLIRGARPGAVTYFLVLTAVALALWTVGGAVVDARSPLRVGPWSGALAVSESTVYVARSSFWTSRPVALTATFPRGESTIVLGSIRWTRRDLTVTLPDGAAVRLEAALPIVSGESRAAVSSLGRPPEAQWRPDPTNPDELRWWDGGDLTPITTRNPDLHP